MHPPHPGRNTSDDWFRASEAAGDFMGIRYGHIHTRANEPEWHVLSHCECDGIGGFARLLRAQGVALDPLPATQYPCPGVIGPLWRRWRDRARQPHLAIRPDWLPQPPTTQQTTENPAWHLFTKEETHQIIARCRDAKITVNSHLLHALDHTVRPEIRDPSLAIAWLIPVNLRGNLPCMEDDTRNHVSCVEVPIAAGDTPQAIQRRIRRHLDRGEHRANQLLLEIGRILKHHTKVKMIRKSRTKPAGNIGSFSNLGVWNAIHTPTTDDGWVFCPPVVSGQLLTAGCVTYNGRLGLATQGIPAAASSSERMTQWVRNICHTSH